MDREHELTKVERKEQKKQLMTNPKVQSFLQIANELCGVGKEAAFVVSMAHSGAKFLRSLAFTKEHLKLLREPADDLELSFRLYLLTLDKSGKNLLRKICHNSGFKTHRIVEIAELASELAAGHSTNLFYTERRRVDQDTRTFKSIVLHDANKVGFLTISALSYAFCQAFNDNICNFYDLNGDGNGVFFSLAHGRSVNLPEHSFACKSTLWAKENKNQIVAYSFSQNEMDAEVLNAFFVCRLPCSLIHEYPVEQLNQLKINIGPMVAEKLLSNDFVKKYCGGDLAIFRGYNPATGVLSLTCSARSAFKFCQLADGTVNSIFEMLDTMDNLRWLDEQCGALVSFGPGFQVSRIIANPSEEVKDTIVVTFGESFGEFEPAVLQLTELSENFCEYRSCNPLLFTKSRRFFITLLTPSIVKELKPILESAFTNTSRESTVTVETKSGNIFEYFAGYNAKNSVGCFLDDSSYPTECCAICFAPIVGKYIRLSLCGHVYCDDCFIGLLKNATQFPVSCQSGCLYQILFEDIALVLSRNFPDVDEIQQFLTPVFHISLDSFLYTHRSEFIRCQTADCHSLMPLTKEGAISAVGTSMICIGCEMKRCTLCGEAVHQHITCQERQEQKFGIEYPDLTAWKNELPTHRRLCPNVHCKMLIEKGPGCNHMYCNQCGVHFCWLCINFQAGTTDEVYRHLRELHGSIGEPGFIDDEVNQHFGLLVQQIGYERAAVMMNVEVAPDGLMMTDPYYAHALMVIEAYTQKEEQEENEEEGGNEDPLLKYGDNLEAMYRQYKKDCEESRQALM